MRVDVASGRGDAVVQTATHPLERPIVREAGPVRIVGISTTVMNRDAPRYSTSERLLGVALEHASSELGAETRLLKLNDLKFRNCEGYYSKSAQSCTWPCTITQADAADEMQQVYEALVFWADVLVLATPIRWGNASSLFYKMAERMNCIQNQITINDRVLIRNKVATFIITGGQDNIQGVAGQLLTLLLGDRLSVPAVSVHRAQPGMGCGGHGAQHGRGGEERGLAGGRAAAGDAGRQHGGALAGPGSQSGIDTEGRPEGVAVADGNVGGRRSRGS